MGIMSLPHYLFFCFSHFSSHLSIGHWLPRDDNTKVAINDTVGVDVAAFHFTVSFLLSFLFLHNTSNLEGLT